MRVYVCIDIDSEISQSRINVALSVAVSGALYSPSSWHHTLLFLLPSTALIILLYFFSPPNCSPPVSSRHHTASLRSPHAHQPMQPQRHTAPLQSTVPYMYVHAFQFRLVVSRASPYPPRYCSCAITIMQSRGWRARLSGWQHHVM